MFQGYMHHDLCRLTESLPMGERLPLSEFTVFPGGNEGLSTIHFVDGDSGYIAFGEDLFSEYSDRTLCPEVKFSDGRVQRWIPFRDSFHDAIEIGHRFTVKTGNDTERYDFGLQGFWKANEIIHNAHEVALLWMKNPAESSSGREGARYEVSLFVRAEDGVWTPFAIEMLKCGLSFVTDIGRSLVSADYIAAERYAQQNKKGLHGILPAELLVQSLIEDPKKDLPATLRCSLSDCMPWKIRNKNLPLKLAYNDSTSIEVSYYRASVHQCIVFVERSTIDGAGYGLFLRPVKNNMYFGLGTILCWYADKLLPASAWDTLDNTDYVIEVESRGKKLLADGTDFNGYNLGRFVNQGGLQEGLQRLANDISVAGVNLAACEDVASSKCNLKFGFGNTPATKSRPCLKVSVKELRWGIDKAEELFVNYSIRAYWIPLLSKMDAANGILTDDSSGLFGLVRWIVAENARRESPISLGHMYSDEQVTEFKNNLLEPPAGVGISRRRR